MTRAGTTGRNLTAATTLVLTACLFALGCNDATLVSGRTGTAGSVVHSEAAADVESREPRIDAGESSDAEPGNTPTVSDSAVATPIEVPIAGNAPSESKPAPGKEPEKPPVPVEDRTFRTEGPDGASRIAFDDLDLLKVLKMDPVTNDCVEKMPPWLKGLNGKNVRIRGFMKPGLVMTGIPQFMLVRDTGLCCFGPKGKIYDMIATTLKPPTTTDYIELRPFDVVGRFRIELLEEDGIIFGLYYLDDAQIIQK